MGHGVALGNGAEQRLIPQFRVALCRGHRHERIPLYSDHGSAKVLLHAKADV